MLQKACTTVVEVSSGHVANVAMTWAGSASLTACHEHQETTVTNGGQLSGQGDWVDRDQRGRRHILRQRGSASQTLLSTASASEFP